MKYILNSNFPENWGNEAYNGMEITQEELERLASEWDTPISELMSDLERVSDDDKRVTEFCLRLTDNWEISKI